MLWICLKPKNISASLLKGTWITCLICFTFLMCGAARIFTSFLMSQLSGKNSPIKITNDDISWLGSLCTLSNPLGILLGGFMMDRIGRKWTTICVLPPFIAGWGLIACATNLPALYIGTSLHGVGSGMTMSASVYISEVSSSEYRGLFLSVLGLSYMFGTVMCSITNYLLLWRYTASYFFIASIVMFMLVQFIPESPYWLVLKGRTGDATKVLESIRKSEDAIKKEIADIETCISSKKTGSLANKIKLLLAAWRQMAILTTFSVLHKLSGFTPLNQYTVIFFQELNVPGVDAYMASVLHTVVCFVSTFAVPYFVHRCNRRTLLASTSIAAALSMLVTLLYEYHFYHLETKPFFWIPLLGVFGYDAAATVGITSISVMLPGELLPTEISGLACTIFSIFCNIIYTFINKTYLMISLNLGLVCMLCSFVFVCILIAVLSVTILPETRGKTLREIQDTYFPKKYERKTDPYPAANCLTNI